MKMRCRIRLPCWGDGVGWPAFSVRLSCFLLHRCWAVLHLAMTSIFGGMCGYRALCFSMLWHRAIRRYCRERSDCASFPKPVLPVIWQHCCCRCRYIIFSDSAVSYRLWSCLRPLRFFSSGYTVAEVLHRNNRFLCGRHGMRENAWSSWEYIWRWADSWRHCSITCLSVLSIGRSEMLIWAIIRRGMLL